MTKRTSLALRPTPLLRDSSALLSHCAWLVHAAPRSTTPSQAGAFPHCLAPQKTQPLITGIWKLVSWLFTAPRSHKKSRSGEVNDQVHEPSDDFLVIPAVLHVWMSPLWNQERQATERLPQLSCHRRVVASYLCLTNRKLPWSWLVGSDADVR